MLDRKTAETKIADIDAALRGQPARTPVAFGFALFEALVKQGLVNDALAAPGGEEGDVAEATKYRDTHPARLDTSLPDDGFAVG